MVFQYFMEPNVEIVYQKYILLRRKAYHSYLLGLYGNKTSQRDHSQQKSFIFLFVTYWGPSWLVGNLTYTLEFGDPWVHL